MVVDSSKAIEPGVSTLPDEVWPGKVVQLRKRSGVVDGGLYKVSNNRKVGTGDDAKVGLPAVAYSRLLEEQDEVSNSNIKGEPDFKPTLIIYFIRPSTGDECEVTDGLVSFVIHFPQRSSLKTFPKIYETNKVWQQLELFENSEDEDAEMAELEDSES